MANTSEQAQAVDGPAVDTESRPHLRVYRWIGLILVPAVVALALLTPSALPEDAPPQIAPSPLAIELSTATLQWINAATAEALADELPTHRRLFGSITEARTLIDLGIPARVVQRLPVQVPAAP